MSINVGYCICISQPEFRAETEQKSMETSDPTSGDVRVELSIDWSKGKSAGNVTMFRGRNLQVSGEEFPQLNPYIGTDPPLKSGFYGIVIQGGSV